MEYKIIKIDKELGELFRGLRESNVVPAKDNADVIRRAVVLYDYLHRQVKDLGGRVAILDKNNKPIKVIDPLP